MKWVLKFGSFERPDDIFEAVIRGEKTIETRPNNPKKNKNYGQIKPGDKLVLISLESGRKLEKTAGFVRIYKSVAEMAANEQVGAVFPGVKSAGELVLVFEELKRKWGREYARKLEQYGIVVIEMY